MIRRPPRSTLFPYTTLFRAPSQPLQFVPRKFSRIAGDAALGAAVRQPGERAFPAHPHRQRRYLSQFHVRMITQAALGRSERLMMLHAVTSEDLRRPIIAMN